MNRRLQAEGRPVTAENITIFAVREEGPDDDDDLGSPVIGGWDLVSFGSDGIEIELNFTDPITVSVGDEPELLLVQIELGGLKSADGMSMPESLVKYMPIPTQMGSKEEAE